MHDFAANAIALVVRSGDYLPRVVRASVAVVLAVLARTQPQVVADGFEIGWRAEAAAASQLLQATLQPMLADLCNLSPLDVAATVWPSSSGRRTTVTRPSWSARRGG